jgi:hypothetical protein
MNRTTNLLRYLLSAIFIFVSGLPVYAEDAHLGINDFDEVHGVNSIGGVSSIIRRRAVVLDIETNVLGENQIVVWNETHRRTAIPGSPVGVQLVGSNVVVAVQFTPFIRHHGNVLVAQGQIWVEDPLKGVSYHTSIQAIPMEFGEPIYFFPLGSSHHLDSSFHSGSSSSIEIVITVNLYSESNTSVADPAINNR